MSPRKITLFCLAILLALAGLAGSWAIVFADGGSETSYFSLTKGQPADVFLGKGGVYMPASAYDGTAMISRYDKMLQYEDGELDFIERWIDFYAYDQFLTQYTVLYGVNYVYFNLSEKTSPLWEEGVLSIYTYNLTQGEWEVCPTKLIAYKNLPKGRLVCIMPYFGLYGLAIKK